MILTDYNLIYLITNIFGTYILFKFMNIFFNRHDINIKVEFISYLIYFIISSLLYLFINIPIFTLVINIILFLVLSFNYSATLKRRLIAVILIYIIMLLVEIIIVLIFGFIDFSLYSSNPHFTSIIGLISLKLVSYTVVLLIGKYRNLKEEEEMPIIYWFAVIFIPIGTIYIIILLLQIDNINSYNLVTGIVILLFVNIITFGLYDRISIMLKKQMEGIILKQQNKHYLEQYKLIKESIYKTNAIRHDIKKHILVIKSLIDKNENDRAIAYINEITDSMSSKNIIANSGNIVIDSIINYKLYDADSKKINVIVRLMIPIKLNISDFDLTVILGNLLDNAIIATSILKNNRSITIQIIYRKETLFIHMENSFNGEVKYSKNKIVTSHDNNEKHGFGLANIKTVLEKYDGIMKVDYTSNDFIVDVMLYVKTTKK